jgi:DNA excision repair protein ERCC-5
MRAAVQKLKSKKGLGGTFADEAKEWAKRNELSYEAQMAKKEERKLARENSKAKGVGSRKGRKRAVEEPVDRTETESNEETAGQNETDEESEAEGTPETNGKGNGNGRGKSKATSTRKPKGRKRAKLSAQGEMDDEMEEG